MTSPLRGVHSHPRGMHLQLTPINSAIPIFSRPGVHLHPLHALATPILGPMCDVQMFYIRNLRISTQKWSTREKSRQIAVNATIHGIIIIIVIIIIITRYFQSGLSSNVTTRTTIDRVSTAVSDSVVTAAE